MVVLELEKGGHLGFLVDNNGEDRAGVELGRGVEVDLPKQAAEASHRSRVPLDLLAEAVDLLRMRK